MRLIYDENRRLGLCFFVVFLGGCYKKKKIRFGNETWPRFEGESFSFLFFSLHFRRIAGKGQTA